MELTAAAWPQENSPAHTISRPRAQRYPVEFTGSGGEYFRIWIVNLLLTIVTFGIYSAWAKVRKLQYFYRNTQIDGSVFDYHGRPTAILKGRLVALALIAFYNFAFQFSIVLGVIAGAVFALLLPWLLTQSQRFKLHNSSYRGLRFRFTGPLREAYAIWAFPLLLGLAAFGVIALADPEAPPSPLALTLLGAVMLLIALLVPWMHYRIKRFQHRHAWFGQARSRFRGSLGRFYLIYVQAALLLIGFAAAAAVIAWFVMSSGSNSAGAVLAIALVLLSYLVFLSISPFIWARVQNHVWNNTLLGLIGFESKVRARRLAFIFITNLIGIVLTLGLFTPFAAIRMLRYRLESMTVLSTTDLAGFVEQRKAEDVAAVGEGAADLLDFDFSL